MSRRQLSRPQASHPIIVTSPTCAQILHSLIASREPAIWSRPGFGAPLAPSNNLTMAWTVLSMAANEVLQVEALHLTQPRPGAVTRALEHVITHLEHSAGLIEDEARNSGMDISLDPLSSLSCVSGDIRSSVTTARAYLTQDIDCANNADWAISGMINGADASLGRMGFRYSVDSTMLDMQYLDHGRTWTILHGVAQDIASRYGRFISEQELVSGANWANVVSRTTPDRLQMYVCTKLQSLSASAYAAGQLRLAEAATAMQEIAVPLTVAAKGGRLSAQDARRYLEGTSKLEYCQLQSIRSAARTGQQSGSSAGHGTLTYEAVSSELVEALID